MSIREKLLRGESKVCFWGLGYIGFSALVYYVHKGVECVGYDISEKVVNNLKKGKSPAPGLDTWLKMNGMSTEVPAEYTSDLGELKRLLAGVDVIKLCIPTEKDGAVSDAYLISTCSQLAEMLDGRETPVLIDIESTVAVRMIDEVVVPAFAGVPGALFSSSPRRDWFISSEKDLATLPRIVGGVTPEAGEWAREVNSIVCRDVVLASTHREASATKAVENALRNISINVVNQMARDTALDVREVCDLVATKWNVGKYNPSLGIGGYCIPLGPSYLIDGNSPGSLGLLHAAVEQTHEHIRWVSEKLVGAGFKTATILGLAYRGDVPVYKFSPSVMIAQALLASGVDVTVSDHYADEAQYAAMFEGGPMPKVKGFPQCLDGSELVVVGSYHGAYGSTAPKSLLNHLDSCKVLIDNEGAFEHVPWWKEKEISYSRPGQRGWLDFAA